MNATAMDETLGLMTAFFDVDLTGASRRRPVEVQGTRVDLARFFDAAGFRVGVEIGVHLGEYSAVLCQMIPDAKIYGVDPYTVRPDYQREGDTQASRDAHLASARARMLPYEDRYRLIIRTSMEALPLFGDGELDFVYIDGHHNFENVALDLCGWSRKVREGGIVAGHDYYETARPGFGLHVKYVVDAFTSAYWIAPWFVIGKRDGAIGQDRDDHRSFAWVNGHRGLEAGR